jgi:hypothetical protein
MLDWMMSVSAPVSLRRHVRFRRAESNAFLAVCEQQCAGNRTSVSWCLNSREHRIVEQIVLGNYGGNYGTDGRFTSAQRGSRNPPSVTAFPSHCFPSSPLSVTAFRLHPNRGVSPSAQAGDDSPASALLDPFPKCTELLLKPQRFPLLYIFPIQL